MSSNMLETHTRHLISAIELCFNNQFRTPSLMLLYATIDIMAWLNRDRNHENVKRDDFIKWTETYLLPNSQLQCTAIDLYAARCSLIHSYSAESGLSREGRASEIFYAWGTADAQYLQELIDRVGSRDAKAVQVEELITALKKGIEQFISRVRNDQLIMDRTKKFFSNVPVVEARIRD
jgi:hypothetical protein